MFFKNLRFLKNACKGILFNADSPYLGSLTIFVWVMPVSILLFAVGVQLSVVLVAFLSISSAAFWHQKNNRTILSPLPIVARRK